MPREKLDLFALVRSHLGKGAAMESSARLNLEDAIQDKNAGRLSRANLKALRALDFLVGICHPDYKRAFRFLFGDQRLVGPLRTSDWWDADNWDEELA